jgi:hypothetical protein
VGVSDDYCYDIVFLALARNCGDTIPGLVRGLENLRQSGLRVHAVIGENGSHDKTRGLLEEAAAATGKVSVVDTSFMSGATERLQRMALGRQFLADYAKDILVRARAICVIDVDEPFLEHLDPGILLAGLQRVKEDDDVFAVSATSRPTYYDLLAFEDEDRSFADLDKRIQRLQRNPVGYYAFFQNVIYPEQQRLTSDSDLRCRSAFNGLCLYRSDSYAMGSYLPLANDPWICEHLTFNRSVAAATGRHMVIDGALVVPTPSEHGRRRLPGFVWQRTRKLPQLLTARLGLKR